jgi:methylamine dehydrogenase accessory protein MauD
LHGWWAASYVVLWVLVIGLAIVVVALARQIGTLHLRLGPRGALEIDGEGPPLGEAVEPFEVTDMSGQNVAIAGPGEAQLLLFVSPGCMVCKQVLPALPVIAAAGRMRPYVITDVDEHETRRAYDGGSIKARVVSGVQIAQRYDVPGTPYVLVLDEQGVVRAKGTVNNLEQMEGLIDTAQRRLQIPGERHSV